MVYVKAKVIHFKVINPQSFWGLGLDMVKFRNECITCRINVLKVTQNMWCIFNIFFYWYSFCLWVCLSIRQFGIFVRNGSLVLIFCTMVDNWNILSLFFSALPKCKFEISKNQFIGSKMIIFTKFGTKLVMRKYLTVFFKVSTYLWEFIWVGYSI